jgi:hypothetical protein
VTEAEIIEQLVEFQSILLLGVSVFVSVISAYMVSLYTFLARTTFLPRLVAFVFLTLVIGFLMAFLYGSSLFHNGLIDTLAEIDAGGSAPLSPAGLAALENARLGIDNMLRTAVYVAAGAFYLGLAALTFWTGWRKQNRTRVLVES